ncbi:hypothetical protein C8J57DRAFT_1213787 [Mycena rebaudengoi]|nr:hypothetical protein C8J57DRAFT_1213787 [Mycena rebaudengoi]
MRNGACPIAFPSVGIRWIERSVAQSRCVEERGASSVQVGDKVCHGGVVGEDAEYCSLSSVGEKYSGSQNASGRYQSWMKVLNTQLGLIQVVVIAADGTTTHELLSGVVTKGLRPTAPPILNHIQGQVELMENGGSICAIQAMGCRRLSRDSENNGIYTNSTNVHTERLGLHDTLVLLPPVEKPSAYTEVEPPRLVDVYLGAWGNAQANLGVEEETGIADGPLGCLCNQFIELWVQTPV